MLNLLTTAVGTTFVKTIGEATFVTLAFSRRLNLAPFILLLLQTATGSRVTGLLWVKKGFVLKDR